MTAPTPAGWYPDTAGGQQYWDGGQWLPQRLLPLAERAEILQRQLVVSAGPMARVVAQSQTSATLIVGQPVNHIFHLLMCMFTCGLWLIVWLLIQSKPSEVRHIVSVDEYGGVHWD